MHRTIELLWRTGTAAGYTDVFPVEEFSSEVSAAERLHLVRGPHGGGHHARYRLRVIGPVAVLDYSAFSDFNVRNGMEVGVMKFEFTDSARTTVGKVLWNDKPVSAIAVAVTTKVTDEPAGAAAAVAKDQQATAQQTLRPGQAAFRQLLDLVYGARCCVTQCQVPSALQAAHITPFADEVTSNSADNGLLLRADIHALFDSNHVAVHPTTRLVYFSPEANSWPEYAAHHAQTKLAHPQPGFDKCPPRGAALADRWARFVDAHGHPHDAS